jgi:hypothetical protein
MVRLAGFRRLHPIVPDRTAFGAAIERKTRGDHAQKKYPSPEHGSAAPLVLMIRPQVRHFQAMVFAIPPRRVPAKDDGRSNHAFHARRHLVGRAGGCAGGSTRAHHELWQRHLAKRQRQQTGGNGIERRLCHAVRLEHVPEKCLGENAKHCPRIMLKGKTRL